MDRPVRLTSDEFDTIVGVANYALKQLGHPNTLSIFAPANGILRSVSQVLSYDMANPLGCLPFRRSISREDLEFLAPYIDEWIAGQWHLRKISPPNIRTSARNDCARLKERMQREGLSPERPVNP